MAKTPKPPKPPKYESEGYAYDWRTRNNLKRGKAMSPKGKVSKGKAC